MQAMYIKELGFLNVKVYRPNPKSVGCQASAE
jgi:hypothetical protein